MHICVHSHIAEIRKVTAKRVDFCSGMGILGLQEVCVSYYLLGSRRRSLSLGRERQAEGRWTGEVTNCFRLTNPPLCSSGPEKLPSLDHRDSPRHRGPTSARPKMLVISGGDGYEDFRLSSGGGSSSETVGRDDSTNHLLLWRV